MAKAKANMVPVLITTEFRGVFFGWADESTLHDDTITLKDARNCIYWTSSVGGFAGLAEAGPLDGCRIGAQVGTMQLRKITSICMCTDDAAKRWKEFACIS